MIDMTLAEVAEVVGGTLCDAPDPGAIIHGSVEFDSRKVIPGGLFVAISGARVDGHRFSEQAVASGAVAVLAARPVGVPAIVVKPEGRASGNAEAFLHDADGSAAAVVGALSRLAAEVIRRLSARGLTVIGITGSAGKTSTKDLIAAVLATDGATIAPPGSFNNEIGLPYTALRCTDETKYLVAEMSARGIGHIRHLTHITPPQIGVVLNVGSAHLGEFGSRENIAQAKGELVEALSPSGVAVLNADDALVSAMAHRTQARAVTFSAQKSSRAGQEADIFADTITLDSLARPSFDLVHGRQRHPVQLQVFGAHQTSNALAAAAVGIECGLSLETVAQALSLAGPASAHRMDVRTRADGVTIINDAYNANPESMRAGLAALGTTASSRENASSWAVLSEMGELGADSQVRHEELASVLVEHGINHLVAVGTSQDVIALAQAARHLNVDTVLAQDTQEAVALLETQLSSRDVVLVKASHAQELWKVAEALLE